MISDWSRPSGDKERNDKAWRKASETDLDRILYSPEFRRLSGVTQVFSPQDDYVHHDRLTHSIKVAQIAERLAQYLLNNLARRRSKKQVDSEVRSGRLKLDPQVCFAAGLAHDLGHPPFGHAAEKELQELLQKEGYLKDSFEGNAQSMRIVTRLSFRKSLYAAAAEEGVVTFSTEAPGESCFREEEGLDLSWRTIAAIAKYPWLKGQHPEVNPKLRKKWSFYNTEEKYFKTLLEYGFIWPHDGENHESNLKQSLEAQVMDWADDITYAVHDIEDHFRAQSIPLYYLAHSPVDGTDDPSNIQSYAGFLGSREWEDLYEYISTRVRASVRDSWSGEILNCSEEEILTSIAAIRSQFPKREFDGGSASHGKLQFFANSMIVHLQQGARIKKSPYGTYYLEVRKSAQIWAEILKSILKYYVLSSPQMLVTQIGQSQVVNQLYYRLYDTCHQSWTERDSNSDSSNTSWKNLPTRLGEYLSFLFQDADSGPFPNKSARISRTVIDFMCGLTDRQATLLHARLTGNSVSGLSPYWLNI